jgi:hypothetical protein
LSNVYSTHTGKATAMENCLYIRFAVAGEANKMIRQMCIQKSISIDFKLNAFGKTNLYSQIRCCVAGNIDQLIALTNCNRCEQIAFFVLTIRQKVTPKCQMPNI